jgi:ubiquinone/menaquinone biosynthesis C-methylase UbiE
MRKNKFSLMFKSYLGFIFVLLLLIFGMVYIFAENPHNRTHALKSSSWEEAVRALKERIEIRGDLPHISVEGQWELVDQLCLFPFGRYMIERKGANGFWTDYLIAYPKRSFFHQYSDRVSPLEDFILNRSLVILSHRERFQINQSLMQELLKEGAVLASVPCGLMRDLITLDFSNISNFSLVGLDIDAESLALAKEFALSQGIANIKLLQQDAWGMEFTEEFDVMTSSGLNVYEPDPAKVMELYRRFYNALKPGGSLIISVLTYPPGEARPTDWNLEEISGEDLAMERVLYHDVLDLHWRNFRSVHELEKEFYEAGFSKVTVYFDKHRIFPTIHAEKALRKD